MGTIGSANVQLTTIQKHNQSQEHLDATRWEFSSDVDLDVDDVREGGEVSESVSDTDAVVFRTVYYCPKEGIPSEKVNSLLELQSLNGVKTNYKNLSWDTISDIQQSIAAILTSDLLQKVQTSNFYAIMIDESQDIAVSKRLVICVRYVDKKGCVLTEFLCNVHVDDGKAHTITNHIYDTLSSYKFDMNKLVSLGSDGASVMMGRKTGVGVQIQAKYSPFMIHSHCIAHILGLACGDAVSGITVLETFRSKFNSLFYMFTNSAVKTTKLEKIQEVLHDPILRIKEQHKVRWLSSRNAVNAVYLSYPSVVAALAEIGESDAVALGLHKYFAESKTALLTGYMHDVHTLLSVLSCELQKEKLLFREVKPLMEAIIAGLQTLDTGGERYREMKEALGDHYTLKGIELKHLNSKQESDLSSLMKKYTTKLCEDITNRLSEKSEMLNNFAFILDPVTVCQNEDEADSAITKVAEFYGTEKVTKIVNEAQVTNKTKIDPLIDKTQLVQTEWPMLKGIIKGSCKGVSARELCRRVIVMHKQLLPNMCKICEIGLCFCLTSVECERTFSTQNRIKSKFRCSIKSERLDLLIKISMLGPSLSCYDFKRAVRHWYSVKKRRLGRLAQPYKPSGPRAKKAKIASFAKK